MGSFVRTITTPFRKVSTLFNPAPNKEKKHCKQEEDDAHSRNLQNQVMACGYEDVQVMWSILGKSKDGQV